jgi:hypothetical protein
MLWATCWFMNTYDEMHWKAAKCILCYLQGMKEKTILYQCNVSALLHDCWLL